MGKNNLSTGPIISYIPIASKCEIGADILTLESGATYIILKF